MALGLLPAVLLGVLLNLPQPGKSVQEALMIGDSRTVGLAEQGEPAEADFFAAVGLTAHSVWEQTLSVPHVGKLDLASLLRSTEYGKIYIMLGINELERPTEETTACFRALVTRIRQLQPQAHVILLGNLHVTARRSRTDPICTNPAIDRLNGVIAELARTENLCYLDPNAFSDDETGALDPRKSADNAHLLAREYRALGEWLRDQTELLLKEAEP